MPVIDDFLMTTLDICVIRRLTTDNPVISQLSGNYFGIDYASDSFVSM